MWVGVLFSFWIGTVAPASAAGDHVLPPIFTDVLFGTLLLHDPYVAETASRVVGIQNADWSGNQVCASLLKGSRIPPTEIYIELLQRLRQPGMSTFTQEWAQRLRDQVRKGPYRSRDTQIDLSTGSSIVSFVYPRPAALKAPREFQVQDRNVWTGEAQPLKQNGQPFVSAGAGALRNTTLHVPPPAPPGDEEPVPLFNLDGTVQGFGYIPSADPDSFPSGEAPSAERDAALAELHRVTEEFRSFAQAKVQMDALTMPQFFTLFAETTEAVERLSGYVDNFEQKPWIREFISDLLSGTPEPADFRDHFPVNRNPTFELLTKGVDNYIRLREKLSELQTQ
jgi:hypothetical protein